MHVLPKACLAPPDSSMMRRVVDYELEAWIRAQTGQGCACSCAWKGSGQRQGQEQPHFSWRQQVQYAVGHTVNDYLELTPEVRAHTPIQYLLNRRWPRSRHLFDDPLHYWEIYHRMTDQLTHSLSPHLEDYPTALYEQWETRFTEMESLSMIFQAVWKQQDSQSAKEQITVQKWLVEENDWLAEAFVHMTTVFWFSAFGQLPDVIEIFALMEGRRMVVTRAELELQQSLDYVRLLNHVFEESSARTDNRLETGYTYMMRGESAEILN